MVKDKKDDKNKKGKKEKSPKNKKGYNFRKSTRQKKKYKRSSSSDNDDSDTSGSEWTPGCDDSNDFDVLEYQKFIQKIFPSKNQKEKIKQMNKIDKILKKNKNNKKKKKRKKEKVEESDEDFQESDEDTDSEIDEKEWEKQMKKTAKSIGEKYYADSTEDEEDYVIEYIIEDDENDDDNSQIMSNLEQPKFNIIFTVGGYGDDDDDEDFGGPVTLQQLMGGFEFDEEEIEEKNEVIEKKVAPKDRVFFKGQRVFVQTPKMKKKEAGTIVDKVLIKKKFNNKYKVKLDKGKTMPKVTNKFITLMDDEEADYRESLKQMKELLKLKKTKGNKAMMKQLEKFTAAQEKKDKERKEKEIEAKKHKNQLTFRKLINGKKRVNDFKFFRSLDLEKQEKIINEIKKINEHSNTDTPHRIRLLESDLPTKYKTSALKKINMLSYMDPGSGEYYKIKQWVDNFMRVPFGINKKLPIKFSDGIDVCNKFMEDAKKTLDDCVYGLDDAKMQILQFVGQWITNPNAVGSAIAIKGPPGTGKTTLIKEGISKILQRPFAFLALGGATDSSFLEGHSYTYEGSQWGKVVDILIQCRCMNPVIFFDELDKISNTPKGEEITGILTHLTDTTQNSQFHDKYFSSVDFDLSKVLFIFSYNDESKVNPILKDRMYRIHTDGYKTPQKLVIAKNYLIPKIEKNVNFKKDEINVTDEVLTHIIDNYTENEKGVRNLKRCLEIIYTKLNLYRLMKPDTKLYGKEQSLKIVFPYIVKTEDIKVLLKKGDYSSVPFGMYI